MLTTFMISFERLLFTQLGVSILEWSANNKTDKCHLTVVCRNWHVRELPSFPSHNYETDSRNGIGCGALAVGERYLGRCNYLKSSKRTIYVL